MFSWCLLYDSSKAVFFFWIRKGKKKQLSDVFTLNSRESERNYVLDEDDYELLQESNITVPRPKLVMPLSYIVFPCNALKALANSF